jgi:hypothetical protein
VTVPNPPSGTTPAGFDTWATTVATDVNANSDDIADLPGTYVARSGLPRQRPSNGYVMSVGSAITTVTPTADSLRISPLWLPNGGTIDRIGCEVTTAGASGSLTRLGLYEANADGRPGGLLANPGTVSSATTGNKEIALGSPLALAPGIYWAAVVTQGSPSTLPVYRGFLLAGLSRSFAPSAIGFVANTQAAAYAVSGITGALPDPSGATGFVNATSPLVFVRTST